MLHRLRLKNRNQAGFSLIELLIALVIASAVTTAATMVIFQVFNGEARSTNHMDAINRVQNAGSQISLDAGMAQSVTWTDDGDGLPLTLTWTEWESNDVHQVTYSIVDNELHREHFINSVSSETYLFEFIYENHPDTGDPSTYCVWDEDDLTLTFTLTAVVGVGSQQEAETRVYESKPRPTI